MNLMLTFQMLSANRSPAIRNRILKLNSKMQREVDVSAVIGSNVDSLSNQITLIFRAAFAQTPYEQLAYQIWDRRFWYADFDRVQSDIINGDTHPRVVGMTLILDTPDRTVKVRVDIISEFDPFEVNGQPIDPMVS